MERAGRTPGSAVIMRVVYQKSRRYELARMQNYPGLPFTLYTALNSRVHPHDATTYCAMHKHASQAAS